MNRRILIASSGTGGHVIPALAIAQALLGKGYTITWVGTKYGIENKLINNNKIRLRHISSSGIRGKKIVGKILGVFNFIKALYQSYKIIKEEKPYLLIGFGGYVSTSVAILSRILKVNVYIHEANSLPGTANRINNLISTKTFETFPATFKKSPKIIHTGNPTNDLFKSIQGPEFKYTEDKKT